MHYLIQNVKKTIIDNNLLKRGDSLVIGVSGGADSICLVHILASLKEHFNLSLKIVYVDHGLRPEEIPAEKQLVESTAEKLDIPCEINQVNVRFYAQKNKLSLEHAARDLRYNCLGKIAGQCNSSFIAVAHTADDQVEQVLLGLLRGSGMKGLSGMQLCHKNIIRPLLNIKKIIIKQFLAENNISYCEDSSNNDLSFLRNRIRHKLLPYLINNFDKGVEESLLKCAAIFSKDELLLDELTEIAMHDHVVINSTEDTPVAILDRLSVNSLHVAIQRRLVEKILWAIGSKASYEHIIKIVDVLQDGNVGSELHLKQGLRVIVQKHALQFVYPVGKMAWRGCCKKNKM